MDKSFLDVYSIDEILENKEIIYQIADACLTNEHKLSLFLRNLLFEKVVEIPLEKSSFYYELDDESKLWGIQKNKKLLCIKLGYIFDELIENYPKEKFESMDLIKLDNFRYKALSSYLTVSKRNNLINGINLSVKNTDKFINNLDSSPYELPLINNKVINLKYNVIRERGNPASLLPLINNDLKKYEEFKTPDYWTFEINAKIIKDTSKPNEFFKKLMCGCDKKTKYLQQILGSCLINKNLSQSFFIFTGEGSNGKSTLINIMKYFLNDVSKSIDPNLIIENQSNKYSNSNSANPFIVALKNKRFLFLSETKKNDKLKEDFVKQITGDDTITTRSLYSNEVLEFTVGATPILITNFKPTFDISKKAMLRRFKTIEFKANFVDKKSKIKNKNDYLGDSKFFDDEFLPNKDSYFSWLVEGAYSFLNENIKLDPPEEIKKDIESYINEIDLISQFYNDKLEKTENNKDRIKKNIIYDNFKSFCENAGVPYKPKKEFYAEFEKIQKPVKINGYYYYDNLIFKEDEEFQDEDDIIEPYGL